MQLRLFGLALFIALTPQSYAQSAPAAWVPFYNVEYNDLGERTTRWGWFDATGAVVRPATLVAGRVERYAEGRAVACLDAREDAYGMYRERCGFLDEGGAWVVEPIYDKAESFHEGHALVNLGASYDGFGGRSGFIDAEGHVVVPLDYSYAASFSEGLALVALDEDGERQAFIDPSGHVVFTVPDSVRVQGSLVEGRIAASTGGYSEPEYGYLDRAGGWAILPRFTWGGDFSDGLAPVTFEEDDVKRAGFIDTTGALILTLPLPVNAARPFSEGLAVVADVHRGDDGRYRSTYGYIDRSGAFVVELGLDDATPFQDGRAIALRSDGRWVVLDPSGAEVAEVEGLWGGACDDSGDVAAFDPFVNGLAAFRDNLCSDTSGTRGYVSRDGRIVRDIRAGIGNTH